MNGNGKWCAQDKINNKQNLVIQKKDKYNDVINKYLQKINDQKRKSLILRDESFENYKAFKKSYTNAKNCVTVIETSSKESIQDPKATHV